MSFNYFRTHKATTPAFIKSVITLVINQRGEIVFFFRGKKIEPVLGGEIIFRSLYRCGT